MLHARNAGLVQIVDAALADAARRAGPFLVCRAGCTQCCHGAFAINALDAERLRKGMTELSRMKPLLAAIVQRRARAWIEEYASEFPGDMQTGILGTSEADRERFEEFADDAACPALDPERGLCNVYDWRPMTCRVFGPPVRIAVEDESEGLGHCELCFIGATSEQITACEMQAPHALEVELLNGIGSMDETVVAYALLGEARGAYDAR